MPSDKVTQHQLGLFHGYPQWWKKHQADLARQREAPLESPSGGGQANDLRSNTERYLGRTTSVVGSGGSRGGGLGLISETGGQLVWRHSGEYGGDPQVLGPPASMTRGTVSRGGVGPSLRNPMGMFSKPASHQAAIQIPASCSATYIFTCAFQLQARLIIISFPVQSHTGHPSVPSPPQRAVTQQQQCRQKLYVVHRRYNRP
jgi:hypothetical protein